MSWSCGDDPFVMTALAMHDDKSFVVGWWGAAGAEEQEQKETFEAALSTFTFE